MADTPKMGWFLKLVLKFLIGLSQDVLDNLLEKVQAARAEKSTVE